MLEKIMEFRNIQEKWENIVLKVTCAKGQLIQNVFLVPSFRPKIQRNFFKDFCPSPFREVKSKE